MKKLKKQIGVFVLLIISILCIPNNVKAAKMSDEFKSILNKDGYLEVDSVPPTTLDQVGLLIGDYVLSVRTEGLFGVYPSSCNSDFTICDIEKYDDGERHPVKILYKYDNNIKEIVDEYAKKIKDKNYFAVRDMEVVNFWINAKGSEDLVKDYSTELKEYLDFKNFQFDIRMGTPGEFLRSTGGEGNLVYNGTIYYFGGFTEVEAKHILYVPENTGDSKEALIEAIQKRIDNYIGKDIVDITYGGNVYDYFINNFDKDINDTKSELESELSKPSNEQDALKIMDLEWYLDNYKNYKTEFINDWTNKDGYYGFLTEAESGHYFYATIPGNAGSENVFKFIVIKDNDKMFAPSHITTDVTTNVTISSNDSSIPLDTTINAKELTSGTEYERIVEILNLTDNLTFDLKLYSDSISKYITHLNNGEFEVKIPIPKEFKEKNLFVYYVDSNNVPEEYKVEVKDGYAVFKTNHFSIYTLGYKETSLTKIKVTFDANTGIFSNNKNIIEFDDITKLNYSTIEKPTKKSHKFKGFYTEKSGGKSFEEIMNSEAGIEENITFYAQWQENSIVSPSESETENPKTFDSIGSSILIGIIALIGVIGTVIYLKKEIK